MKSTFFISIQGSYKQLELSLHKNNTCLQTIKDKNLKASSLLIPYLEKILAENRLNFADIKFICTDQGPGAFTSLRVAIATINGLAFANQIPVIGIDGLDALAQETISKYSQKSPEYLVCLLNAYNQDVYFSINKIGQNNKLEPANQFEQTKGYKKIDDLAAELKVKLEGSKILFTGNGTELHKELIQNHFADNAIIFEQETCSANQIAKMALEKWNTQKDLSFKIYPLYLKSQTFSVQPGLRLPGNTSNTTQSKSASLN